MSSYFNCAAYDDVYTTIRLNDNVVFLALKIKAKDTDMHLTLSLLRKLILPTWRTRNTLATSPLKLSMTTRNMTTRNMLWLFRFNFGVNVSPDRLVGANSFSGG